MNDTIKSHFRGSLWDDLPMELTVEIFRHFAISFRPTLVPFVPGIKGSLTGSGKVKRSSPRISMASSGRVTPTPFASVEASPPSSPPSLRFWNEPSLLRLCLVCSTWKTLIENEILTRPISLDITEVGRICLLSFHAKSVFLLAGAHFESPRHSRLPPKT